jgi:hypothetical protein
MLVSIKLQDNIPCEYVCQMLQKALVEYGKHNSMTDSVLVIDIHKVHDDITMIPKLELKDSLT